MTRRISMFAVIAATSVAAGCVATAAPPASTKASYERQMRAAGNAYDKDKSNLLTVRQADIGHLPKFARMNGQLALVYRRFVARLVAIAPPTQVASDHRVFIMAFRQMATLFDKARAAAVRGDGVEAAQLQMAALGAGTSTAVFTARADFEAKHYNLGAGLTP